MAQRPLPRLGDLELTLLEFLWRVGPCTVTDAHLAVGAPRAITPNTVGSAMERLYRKGLLTRAKVSHAYQYRPTVSREQFAARRILEAAPSPSLTRVGLLSAFVELVAEQDESSLDHLQALINARRNKGVTE